MTDQFWKYLPHVPVNLKKPLSAKRKVEMADKEVLNLTGGLFPITLVDSIQNVHSKPAQDKKHSSNEKWVYTPILQRNTKIGPIYHWTKESDAKKLYHGEKFNFETEIVDFSETEYLQLPIANTLGWSYGRCKQLFDLLRKYNLNFIVVQDRLSETHSIEDLKQVCAVLVQVYFGVCREVLSLRGKQDEQLTGLIYDKQYECNRKYELEKYMMRNKVDTDREKMLINEIHRLQIMIRKEEREQINLKKALKLEEAPQELFQIDTIANLSDLKSSQKVYSRQQYLCKHLNLPGKVNERLTEVLHGMNIPERIIANAVNTDLYDKLRQKILLMFSIQRYIRKKETERRVLDEKRKRLVSQEEDDKKVYMKQNEGLPKKKVHLNKQ